MNQLPYYEKTVKAGATIYKYRYFSLRKVGATIGRGKKEKLSSLPQQVRNWISSAQKLIWIVNTNFVPGDLYITLTYEGKQPSASEAKKQLDKYIRRIRAYRRKNNLPELKYIAVTEFREGSRIHHHIIMSAMSSDVARRIWQHEPDPKHRGKERRIKGHDRAATDTLDNSGDYEFIGKYIGKENKKGSHRWQQSRNIKPPQISEPKEITRAAITTQPKAPKGYILVHWERRADSFGNDALMMRCLKIQD